MRYIYAKHEPYKTGHLGKVVEEMKLTGPPTIRVVVYKDKYFALEGSHRLAAAHILGFCPKIVVLGKDTDGANEFWDKVEGTLPVYDFDHLLVFDFEKFEKEV